MEAQEKTNSFCPQCNLKFEGTEAVYCCKCGAKLEALDLKVEPVQRKGEVSEGVADPVCPTYTGSTGM